ncbi:uncharacterized protein TNCV_4465501 [Trichonephila clavipes]|nr:uncharacterized protein TNCV_4465501 [Trichonephila clavipes]
MDLPWPGQAHMVVIDKLIMDIGTAIQENLHRNIRDIANEFKVLIGSVLNWFHDQPSGRGSRVIETHCYRWALDHALNNSLDSIWNLTDSMITIQYLKNSPNIMDSTGLDIICKLTRLVQRKQVYLQWIPLLVGVLGNETADELDGGVVISLAPVHLVLIHYEIHSLRRVQINLTWRNPPAYHWYAAMSPGLSLQSKRSRALQTALLSLRSGPLCVAAVAEWYRYRTVACFVTGSSPVPLKTHRVGQRCTLNLSRAETSSRWCGVVVRRGGASSGVVHVTRPWFKITWSVAKSPRVAEQRDVNIQSINSFISTKKGS